MTRSEYIELRAELRSAADVRLIRTAGDSNPRVYGVRRANNGLVSIRLTGGWIACMEGCTLAVHPCTVNEYLLHT